MVLSFLIIALCIVVLLCVCFGKCRLPCKPLPQARQVEAQSPQRRSHRRHLIPQPSPKNKRPSSLNNTTTVQQTPERQQRHTSLPPNNSVSAPLAALSSPLALRPKISVPPQNGAQQLAEAIASLPTSSSSNKVVHLSQLNAESFQKITGGGNNAATAQQRSASMSSRAAPAARSDHQRKGSDTRAPSGQTGSRIGRPADIPESGLPYQPQKSPYTPRDYSTTRSAYSFPPRSNGGQPLGIPIPYLSNVRNESPIPDMYTGDDISSAANEPSNIPTNNETSHNESTDSGQLSSRDLPPSYSTVV